MIKSGFQDLGGVVCLFVFFFAEIWVLLNAENFGVVDLIVAMEL